MIRFVNTPAASVPTPTTDRTTLFVDDTGLPSYKDEGGVVHSLGGEPLPSGGTTGQLLSKASSSDYDTEWKTVQASDVGAVSLNGNDTVNGNKKFTENFLLERVNTAGAEVTVRTTAANAPVIHYEYRNESTPDGRPLANQLIGAAGARPWAGTDWTTHSAAAYHFGAAENHTSTTQATFINLSITPYGSTTSSRFSCATFNADGDVINSRGLTGRMVNPGERGRGLQVLRQANAELSVASFGNAAYVAFYRGVVAGGTPSAPTATAANAGSGFGLIGHDGSNFTGAKGIVGVLAAENYTTTANGTQVVVETTPLGSLARTRQATFLPNGGMLIANVSTVPATPTGGGVFYVEGGALKYKGSSGTVTVIAPA